MITLKKHFKTGGFSFELIKAGKKSLIYKKSRKTIFIAYEVHKIRTKNKRTVKGISLSESIRRPSDEDFGKWGWSCSTLEQAMLKFSKLEHSTTKKTWKNHQKTLS